MSESPGAYQTNLFPVDGLSLSLELTGRVIPKQRPRFSKGHSYLPSGYRNWKDAAIAQLLTQYTGTAFTRVAVTINILGSARGDLDNLAGAVLDALTQSGILVDDRLSCVPELTVKHVPGTQHGARITIQELK
jgi:Holliday junction resolvase RusA-like endonuclease